MITVYVTKTDNRDETHYCLDDGVLFPSNGTLVLIGERNDAGHIMDGHVYAPGQWKEVNIQSEE